MSREILGDERYLRLNLTLPNQTACDDWRQVENLVKLANSHHTDTIIDATVKWLQANWFDHPREVSVAAGTY